MILKIGETIKTLRHRDGRTQEHLATSLGVTFQAVSRWESGNGYPDMELIPAIANYFHVTIDQLFGYDNDRDIRVRTLIATADKTVRNGGELGDCIADLRAGVAEFPTEAEIWVRLGYALILEGYLTFKKSH